VEEKEDEKREAQKENEGGQALIFFYLFISVYA